MTRAKYVIGNWKMYKTSRESADYIAALAPQIANVKENIYLAVPFTSIAMAAKAAEGTSIVIGAQNMNDAREGAFTGEIAGLMLKEAGARFVLVGHSERRHLFHETNEFIHRKVVRAIQDELQPILCVGETQKERQSNKTQDVIKAQITEALGTLSATDAEEVLLAYEPVWAIGTGDVATPEIIEEMHQFCRGVLEELFGKKTAVKIPILYGGSVNRNNSATVMRQKDVDGVLVGGASLDPDTFAEIIQICTNSKGSP